MLNKAQGIAILRVTLGLLFLVTGLGKFMDPSGITGMLGGLGFPAAGLFAWILIIVEVLGGAALILGKKVDKAVWPLFIVLLVSILLVHLPALDMSNQGTVMNVLWHLVGLGGLLSLHSTGAGKLFA
jgi:putative oxidoreductase